MHRRDGRAVYGSSLENCRGFIAHRGFESHSLRQISRSPYEADFFDDDDVFSGIVECSYFDCKLSGVNPDSLCEFEVTVSKDLFSRRCAEIIDEFVRG